MSHKLRILSFLPVYTKNTTATTPAASADELYKQKLTKWQEEQKKLGKNTNAGEGTRSRLKKEADAEFAKAKPSTGSAPTATRESYYISEEADYKAEDSPENVSTGDTIEWDFTKKTKGLHVNLGIKPLYNLFKSEPGAIEELEAYLKLPIEEKIAQ